MNPVHWTIAGLTAAALACAIQGPTGEPSQPEGTAPPTRPPDLPRPAEPADAGGDASDAGARAP